MGDLCYSSYGRLSVYVPSEWVSASFHFLADVFYAVLAFITGITYIFHQDVR